ncbi:hypothetical protein LG634_03765 [Streptomyces bambusae]|uniref:hypothetical protein n=1 Tax=Streptomyces bambusae TaxID=1550616 RepID=UPI001CFEE07F|nr:hypothetical protein [Streptomyces bambusae]MCB5163953.1 hypothetical protein [Streptomyces bambusae]
MSAEVRAAGRWPLADHREADWLRELTADDGLTGFMPPGLPDAAWVLHAMYEHELGPADVSYREYRRAVLNGRGAELAPDLDPAEVLGHPTGEHPGPRWHRRRWAELARRFGDPTVPEGLFPCRTSFPSIPSGAWPAGLQAPAEGHLERADWNRLVDLLTAHSPRGADTPCLAYYSPLLRLAEFEVHIRAGVLGDAKDLYDHPDEDRWTPSNLWARDRTWVTCTDYDLWATKVAGPAALVESLLGDAEVEAVRLPWAA